jgi:hypothetical protein
MSTPRADNELERVTSALSRQSRVGTGGLRRARNGRKGLQNRPSWIPASTPPFPPFPVEVCAKQRRWPVQRARPSRHTSGASPGLMRPRRPSNCSASTVGRSRRGNSRVRNALIPFAGQFSPLRRSRRVEGPNAQRSLGAGGRVARSRAMPGRSPASVQAGPSAAVALGPSTRQATPRAHAVPPAVLPRPGLRMSLRAQI